jgi:aspartyl-tRNA(Asn)/glutamyl-tRNA(Gln) amidotransferase subunit A
VDEVDPGWGDPIDMEHCLFASSYAGTLGPLLDRWGERMDPGLVAIARHGMRYSAADYCRAQGERLAYYDRVHAFFRRYDLLLTPSLSVAAFPAERLIPAHWAQHEWDWLRWAGFSYPFNLTWLPAATCPCGFNADGLPAGIQIVAGRFQDARVLRAARVFEQLRPWAQFRPGM